MKTRSLLVFCIGALAAVFLAWADLGLDYVAKSNGATNSTAYLSRIQADLEAQGLQRMQDELYSAGNARSRTLATVHPRTRAAILYLLQLDGWVPDGSGAQPPAFDPAIADTRIENLGNAIPRP